LLVPTTHLPALLLLVLSLVCLGSWANMFKLTGTRWRFELFYFDFAVGVLVLAVIAAYTFGTYGDLAFSDRMLVAGRVAQIWIVLAGIVFNLGNILLVAAISLLGMSFAFPLAVGTGLVIWCSLQIRTTNAPLVSLGIVLMILTVVLDAMACRKAVGNTSKAASGNSKLRRRATKGILSGVLGGVALGFFSSVAAGSMDPEFGVGPYAAVLLFGVGIFISSVVFSFYFM
jgi:glucose uptake protein